MESNQEIVLESKTKTEKMYKRYQTMWFDYKEEHGIENDLDDKNLLDFFKKKQVFPKHHLVHLLLHKHILYWYPQH